MRLNIRQMATPRSLALTFDKVDPAPRQIGGFTVLLGDIGGQIAVVQKPARQHISVPVIGRIGMVMPRVVARIALVAQVLIVAQCTRRIIKPVRPLRPHPVVTLENIKPAFRHTRPDHAVGFQTQTGHALGIGGHMRLAHQPAAHARIAQIIPHRALADL